MADDKVDKKKIEQGIANMSEVIKQISKNKKGIVDAAKNLNEVIKVAAAVAKALDSPEAKKAITVSSDITEVLNGIGKMAQAMTKPINKINSVSRKNLRQARHRVKSITKTIISIVGSVSAVKDINIDFDSVKSKMKSISMAIGALSGLIKQIKNIKVAFMRMRAMRISRAIKAIKSLVQNIIKLSSVKGIGVSVKKRLDQIRDLIGALSSIMVVVKKTKTVLVRYKIKKINRIIKDLKVLVRNIVTLSKIKGTTAAVKSLNTIKILMGETAAIIKIVKHIKSSGINRKVKKIIRGLKAIKRLVHKIIRMSKIRGTTAAMRRLMKIRMIFSALKSIMLTALMLAPISMIFVVASPLLIVCIGAAGFVLKILIRVMIHFLRSPMMIIATVVIAGLVALNMGLVILALSILVLGLLAIPALMALPMVLIFMIGLIGLILIFAAFGLVVELAFPLLAAGIIGIALVTVAVLCVVVIALLLLLLQTLELDAEKIRENVKKVLDTASQIIIWVGEPLDKDSTLEEDAGSEKPAPGLLDMLGNGLIKLIGALYGASILIPTLIAVMCVMLIALMLRLIQNLNLDYGRIRDNVMLVFDIANWIIEFITEPQADRFTNSDKQDAVTAICGEVYKPALKFIDAIAGAATLIIMVFAVLSILLIATMLRLLQNLDLDEGKIMNNVQMVMTICDHIIDGIFAPDNEDDSKSDRGILGTLIAWIYKPLANVLDAIFAMAYLAVMAIAIICLWGIAKLLQVIQDLDLNETQILNNVDKILRITQHIIDTIFNPDDENDEKSSRGILGTLIAWVYKPLAKVLDAIFAMAYLAVMAIAVLCLLGIAKLLQMIQELELDENKIMTNVETVLRVCHAIIEMIFNPDEESDEKSSRGILGTLISWVYPPLGKVLEAIFAMAYLAVMAIAIICVLAIAKLLTFIGEIDTAILETAQENAQLTMDTALMISNLIYKEDDQSQSQSSRGGIAAFISWVDPGLGQIFQAILTIAYLALMIIAMVIVLGMVKVMAEIGKIDRSIIENAVGNVEIVIGAGHDIVNRVYEGSDDGSQESNRGALLKIVEWIAGKDVADIISAMLTIAHLALMFFAIYIVAGIAKSLNEIGEIDRDKISRARDNVDLVMSTAQYVMERLMSGDYELPEGNDDNLPTLLKWLLPDELKSIIKAIMTIAALAFAEVMIGALGEIAKGLSKVANIDTSAIATAKQKATEIVDASGSILKQMKTNITGQFNGNEFEQTAKIIKELSGLMVAVASIGDSLTKLAQQEEIDIDAAVEKTIKVYQGCLAIIEAIAQPPEIEGKKAAWVEVMGALAPGSSVIAAHWMIFEQYEAYAERLKALGKVVKEAATTIKNLTGLMTEIPKLTKVMQEVVTSSSGTPIEQATSIVSGVWKSISKMFLEIYNSARDDDETWLSERNYNQISDILTGMNGLIKQMNAVIVSLANMFKNIKALATWFPSMSSIEIPSNLESNMLSLFKLTRRIIVCAVGAGSTLSTSWDSLSEKATAATSAAKNTSNLIQTYNGMVPYIQMLADSLTGLNVNSDVINANTIKVKDALRNMFSIIKSATRPTKPEVVRQNMDLMDRINQSITSFTHVTTQDVKNSKDLTDNYIAFLTRVNTMDFNKLKTTEQLMKHWADMSRSINGNFQGLAQAINEHIMPALQKLDKTMDESVKVQKQIIEDLAKPIDVSNVVSNGSPSTPATPTDPNSKPTSSPTDTGGASGPDFHAGGFSSPSSSMSVGSGTDYIPTEEMAYGGFTDSEPIDDSANEPIRNEAPSFLAPYGYQHNDKKKSAIERCIDGDALRVKIVN